MFVTFSRHKYGTYLAGDGDKLYTILTHRVYFVNFGKSKFTHAELRAIANSKHYLMECSRIITSIGSTRKI